MWLVRVCALLPAVVWLACALLGISESYESLAHPRRPYDYTLRWAWAANAGVSVALIVIGAVVARFTRARPRWPALTVFLWVMASLATFVTGAKLSMLLGDIDPSNIEKWGLSAAQMGLYILGAIVTGRPAPKDTNARHS